MEKFSKLVSIFVFTVILIGFFGCGHKSDTLKQKGIPKQVYLFTEQFEDTLMKSVLLNETHNEFNNEYFLLKTKTEQGNLNFSFDLKKPRLFKFYSFKPMSIPALIYVTPGDTLSYELDNNIITFKGKNEAHYNFYKELIDLKLNYPVYNHELGILNFKDKQEVFYQEKLDFLNHYIQNKQVSDLFAIKIKDVFKFQYLNGILNRNVIPRGAITKYPQYLEDITIDIFNRNDQDDNEYFYLALINYLYRASEEKFGHNTYSKKALDYQLEIINKSLVGKIEEYAITKVLFEFDSHLSLENTDYLRDKIKFYLSEITEEKYKIVLNRINERLVKINTQLAEKVYSTILLNLDGTRITLKEILNNQGNKIKVIDFWASWCAPCIKEIKKSHLYRKKLVQNKNLEFLYVSIDKNQKSWRKKVEELQEVGMDKNQYIITETESADLIDFFNVNSIPHYAILDSKNNVYLMNSPSPDDTVEFNDIINKIEELELK